MLTRFNSGEIWKGSNAQITVDMFPRCYNASGEITDVVLSFYTTVGGEAVIFSGESVTVSGRMATVVFQPVQLDTLDDGLLRYQVNLSKDGEPKVFNLETAYVIKTPNPYTPIDYMTSEDAEAIINEKIEDYFETSGATEIEEIVTEKMGDYYTSAQTDSAITQAMAAETARTEQTYLKEHQSLADYYTSAQTNSAITTAVQDKVGSATITQIWTGTQEQYDAMTAHTNNILYFING